MCHTLPSATCDSTESLGLSVVDPCHHPIRFFRLQRSTKQMMSIQSASTQRLEFLFLFDRRPYTKHAFLSNPSWLLSSSSFSHHHMETEIGFSFLIWNSISNQTTKTICCDVFVHVFSLCVRRPHRALRTTLLVLMLLTNDTVSATATMMCRDFYGDHAIRGVVLLTIPSENAYTRQLPDLHLETV